MADKKTRKKLINELRKAGHKNRKDDLPIAVEIVFAEIDDLEKEIGRLKNQVVSGKVVFIATGNDTTSGGGSTYDIKIYGVKESMEVQVTICKAGAIPRQIVEAICGEDKIAVLFDGTHGDDHKLSYLVTHSRK